MKGYKTIVFNVVMMLITVLSSIYPDLILDKVMIGGAIEDLFAALAIIWTAGAIVIRAVTTGPMFGE